MELKDRVLSYCGKKNIALARFEKESKLSNGYFNQVKKRPSADKIKNIEEAFPDLNIEWLLTGEGEMLKTSTEQTETTPYTVPLVPISAQGGSFNDFVVSVRDSDCEKVISPVKHVDFALTVTISVPRRPCLPSKACGPWLAHRA